MATDTIIIKWSGGTDRSFPVTNGICAFPLKDLPHGQIMEEYSSMVRLGNEDVKNDCCNLSLPHFHLFLGLSYRLVPVDAPSHGSVSNHKCNPNRLFIMKQSGYP